MKLKIQTQKTFEKDAKKMKKRGKDLSKLKMALNILSEEKQIPEKYRNHKLVGNVRKGGSDFFYESYGKGNTENTRYCIGSMGKMMTASAILQMMQEEKLGLDDEINEHLPMERRHELFKGIKIRHLLSHTSGLTSYGGFPEDDYRTRTFNFDDLYKLTLLMCFIQTKELKDGDQISIHLLEKYQKRFAGITAKDLMVHELGKDDKSKRYQRIDELYKLIIEHVEEFGGGLLFTPGGRFQYSNSGYVLLREILRYKGGASSYEDYMREHIFHAYPEYDITATDFAESFDRENTAIGSYPEANMLIHASKANAAGGSIFSDVRDMAKWDRMLYDDRFLASETREIMFSKPHEVPHSYGLGFIIRGGTFGKMVGHDGANVGFNSHMMRNLDTQDLFIILENVDLAFDKENAHSITEHLETIFYR